MDIKKLEKNKGFLKILIKNSNHAFLNAIRRTIMNKVPVLAIEDVSIYRNDSVLFDEMLAHRLGMLAIKTDIKAYKKGDSVKLILKEKGEKTVYSKNIKCIDPKIEVTHKNIPITKLKEGQELKIEMKAIMNSGKEHAKWQPALVYFKEVPKLNTLRKISNAKEIIKACPAKVLELKAGKITLKNPYDCDLCEYCVDLSKNNLEMKYSKKDFVLTIESYGGLEPKEIIISTAEIMEKQLKELNEKISKL